jgi:pterin-4-alpha-carbinolamine dehydratase (EC 4.2.1.96)
MNDLVPLADAHCSPKRGQEHRLTEATVRELMPQLPGWELAEGGQALSRTFRFDDYYRTMSFVNALAHMANREDHHPDLGPLRPLRGSLVHPRCRRPSENDFICAAKTDLLG